MPNMGVYDVLIECPFFVGRTGSGIRCEGIIPDTTILNEFGRREERDKQCRIYCQCEYQACETYNAIAAYGACSGTPIELGDDDT